jgi:hypothetical protein
LLGKAQKLFAENLDGIKLADLLTKIKVLEKYLALSQRKAGCSSEARMKYMGSQISNRVVELRHF